MRRVACKIIEAQDFQHLCPSAPSSTKGGQSQDNVDAVHILKIINEKKIRVNNSVFFWNNVLFLYYYWTELSKENVCMYKCLCKQISTVNMKLYRQAN